MIPRKLIGIPGEELDAFLKVTRGVVDKMVIEGESPPKLVYEKSDAELTISKNERQSG